MTSVKLPPTREYSEAPPCYGGGFTFLEMNEGLPWRTRDEWQTLLEEADVECDWPDCDILAVEPVVLGRYVPFLCGEHFNLVHHKDSRTRIDFTRLIKEHLEDQVLRLSYGASKKRNQVPRQLEIPFIPYNQRVADDAQPPRAAVQSRPVTRLSLPKLGQNIP